MCKKLKVPEALEGLMLPQPYTPSPEEGASQRSHPFPLSLVLVTDLAAQMSWGKHPPQKAPANLLTILNTMTKQNSINRNKIQQLFSKDKMTLIRDRSVKPTSASNSNRRCRNNISTSAEKNPPLPSLSTYTKPYEGQKKKFSYHVFQSAVMPVQRAHYLCCKKPSA